MDQTLHTIPPNPPSQEPHSRHELPTNTHMDQVNSALPKVVTLTHDCIRMATEGRESHKTHEDYRHKIGTYIKPDS